MMNKTGKVIVTKKDKPNTTKKGTVTKEDDNSEKIALKKLSKKF